MENDLDVGIYGGPALVAACANNHSQIVKMLLNAGIDPGYSNNKALSVIKSFECYSLLLSAGAVPSYFNNGALFQACVLGNTCCSIAS